MIKLIEYQKPVFRLIINGIECKYYPPSTIFIPSQFLPLTTKVKGSTLGWNIKGWVSYNQIKKAIKTNLMKYPIGTKVKLGHLTIEKTAHGWYDSGCNEVVVDESLIGMFYTLINPTHDENFL